MGQLSGQPPPEKAAARLTRGGVAEPGTKIDNSRELRNSRFGRTGQSYPHFAGLRLRRWRFATRGRLLGFADVSIPAFGLAIDDIAIFAGVNGPFAMLPSRPVLDERGQHKRGVDGRLAYAPVCQWSSRRLSDAFSARVVELIRRKYGAEILDFVGPPSRRTRQRAPAGQGVLDFGAAQ